ncbi:MAG: hypothetical protein AB7J32_23870 [Pseudonocardia sp.]
MAGPEGQHHRRRQVQGGQGWTILLGVGATIVLLAAFSVFAAAQGVPFRMLSKDPDAVAGLPPFVGWQAGLCWLIEAFGATSALLAWYLVRRLDGDRTTRRFLLGIGLLAGLLLSDDIFQFHEAVYPALFGIPQDLIYPIYAMVLLAIFVAWGRHVVTEDRTLLVLAGVAFASSLVLDTFGPKHWEYFNLFEDGTKQLGFTLWTLFLVRLAVRCVLTAADARVVEAAAGAERGLSATR